MSFRYLRLEDGLDAGEVELGQPANAGEEIRATEDVRARIRGGVAGGARASAQTLMPTGGLLSDTDFALPAARARGGELN